MRNVWNILSTIVFVLVGFLFSLQPAQAVVSGGPASLTLVPNSVSATTGQNFTIDVALNTGGQAISGTAMRINYPVSSPLDLEVVSISPNSSLGWTFPVQTTSVGSGNMNIDIMGLTSSPTGFTSNGSQTIATITLRATSSFANKQLTFNAANSQVMRKSDASDILGTIGTATITASGGTVTPVTSPEPSPTTDPVSPTPDPTPATTPSSNEGALLDNTSDGSGTDGSSDDYFDVTSDDPDAANFLTQENAGVTFDTADANDTSATGDAGAVTRTGATPNTQPQPVSGAIQTTLAIAGVGTLLLGGAGYLVWKRRKAQKTGDNTPPQQPPSAGGTSSGPTATPTPQPPAAPTQVPTPPTPTQAVGGQGAQPPATPQPPAPPAI